MALLKYRLTSEAKEGDQLESEDEEPMEEEPLVDQWDKQRKSTDPSSCEKEQILERRGGTYEFYDAGIKWVTQVRWHHEDMVDLLIKITSELQVSLDQVLEEAKR